MVMDIQEIIELFNDGDLDIKTYFNDSETFFKVMNKRGVIDELDLEDQYMVNDYLYYLSQNNQEKFVEEIQKYLSDVIFEPGKEPILRVYDRSDLAKLFCESRNDISQETIGEVLEGDYNWDRYWDTTDDVYRDVIEELNEENLGYLSSYMLKNLDGQRIEVDEDSPELLQDYANDDDIFVTDKKEWKYIPHPYRKETQIEVLELPIRDFYTPMKEFVYNNMGTGYTPEYYGDFIKILEENGECLSYWAPDYASSSRTDQNINEIFGDYI